MDDAKRHLLHADTDGRRRRRWCEIGLIVAASLIAAAGARDYAGGWNDGSRLATVESLVDRHTLAIDDSIFVRSPATADAPNPYAPGNELLRTKGTQDKLFIGGRYYSDKSPLPAFWLAAWYELFQSTTGLTAHGHPRLFCYLMTLASAGIAYVVTVWSIWRLALRQELPLAICLLLAGSSALATVALPYTRHVNNHIMLLAVVSLLMLVLDRMVPQTARVKEPCDSEDGESLPISSSHGRLLGAAMAGGLAAIGYTLDLGLGPVLLVCTTLLVVFRRRSILAIGCFALAAVPWLAAHHGLNYATGGTFGPANAVPEYVSWPGSPFSSQNMTGGWAHRNIGHFFLYTAALLFGKHGFLNYNLPLFLVALARLTHLVRRRPNRLPELIFAAAFAGGAWLLYAAMSNNYSGPCCSIRWFVPFVAPAYYVLAVLLRERPELARPLTFLTASGAVLSAVLWWRGPWEGTVPLVLWPLNAAALLAWPWIKARVRPPSEQTNEVAWRQAA
ncbi:MAG TPA: hypothetical protein VHC22_25265 [Pirellulales bacterium]|nr:hypothetical protein [Pirellulales bacterium]